MTTYDVLKDFAGPVATIIGACAAVFVTWRLGRGQNRIATEQSATAKRQADLAAARLQHDQYERRLAVYDAARMFLLRDVLPNLNPSVDEVFAFVQGTADAAFLFDDTIVTYLEEMREKAFRLRFLREAIRPGALPPPRDEQQAWATERKELFEWFGVQPQALVERFKPFLRVPIA
jgi:hypothetical protein